MRAKYNVNNLVTMTESAIETYGEIYRGVTLRIDVVSRSTDDHPGYDEGVGGGLYDLRVHNTEQDLPFSLYDWELKRI